MTVNTQQPAPGRAGIHRQTAESSSGLPTRPARSRDRFHALELGRNVALSLGPMESDAEFDRRLDIWMVDLDARDDVERVMVRRAVAISFELDRLTRAAQARRAALGHTAAALRAARAEEVVVLGHRLFFDPVGPLGLYPHSAPLPAASEPKTTGDRIAQLEGRASRPAAAAEPRRVSHSGRADDPDDPAPIVIRLEATALGCAWLLDRWGELKDILQAGLVWQPHDRFKAVRLLGRQPLEAVDDPRVMSIYTYCWPMDPSEGHAFTDLTSELRVEEKAQFIFRLNAREPKVPEHPEAGRAALLALIAGEEERLEAVLSGHLERQDAELTALLAFDATPDGERLRKYEEKLDRALQRMIEGLRKRHKEADAAATTAPVGRGARRAGSAAASEGAAGPAQPQPAGQAEPDATRPCEQPDRRQEPGPSESRSDPTGPEVQETTVSRLDPPDSTGSDVAGSAVSRSDPSDPTGRRPEPAATMHGTDPVRGTAEPVKPAAPAGRPPAATGRMDDRIRAVLELLSGTFDLTVKPPARERRSAAFKKPALNRGETRPGRAPDIPLAVGDRA